MIRKAFKTCAAGFAAGFGLLAGALPAMGQTPPTTGTPGDWPNLGAFNNRQGKNVNPYAYNSGDTNLRYLTPSTVQERNTLTLDNTDLRLNGFTRGGQYDDPGTTAFGILPTNPVVAPLDPVGLIAPQSFVTPSSKAAWPTPATLDDEAEAANVPVIRSSNNDAARPYNYNLRTTQYFPETRTAANPSAAYSYSYGVPSDPAGDGTQPIAGQAAAYFEYKFVPPAGNERTFALYAHLPVGTTKVPSPANPAVPVRLYPQRYFVYEIRFGPDADANGIPDYRVVDILDTEKAGNGYVRLGVQGNESNTYFPFSTGTAGIRVRLYNTVPRDTMVPALQSSTGQLLLTNAPASNNTTAEVALAKQHLVYADSAVISPYTGTFAASPTTSTLSGNTTNGTITGNTLDAGNQDVTANWNVTAARTSFAYNFAYGSSDLATVYNQDGVNQGRTIRGTFVPDTDGVVSNYQANPVLWPLTATTTPYEKWRFSLAQTSASTTTQDSETAGTTIAGFTSSTVTGGPNPNHIGADYLTAPATTGATTATVTYKPDLADGQYDIYAYIPGDYTSGATERYITGMTYYILEGANIVYAGVLDESQAQGWKKLGTRRYANTQTALPNEALSVVFTNKNVQTGDAPTRIVYADAVKFVGQTSSGFTSTPVHATVGILQADKTTVVDTRVVLVADENGKIHCLDEEGRSDGTTTEYWSYPSTTPSTATEAVPFIDPNLSDMGYDPLNKVYRGTDGTYNPTLGNLNQPTAKMPSGFDLSTAAVARVYPNPANLAAYNDLLYIGSTNGRVYCLNMAGRGDFDAGRRDPGTTKRRWTFPDDYDPSTPSAPSGTGTIGVFRGSVVFGDPLPGGITTPTVYVAARQGRVYALNALGDQATTHTTTRWQFPTVAQNTTLPRISMTPTLFSPTGSGTNRLLFGTLADDTNDGPGQFYCLNAATGVPTWQYNGIVTASPNNPDTRVSATGLDSFVAGPVAVNAATLAQRRSSLTMASGTLPVLYDTVYAMNQNGYLFGLNVADGTLVSDDLPAAAKGSGTHVYFTNTLDALSAQNLTFTFASDYVRGAALLDALQTVPMVVISGDNGVLAQMFARPEDYNAYTDTTIDATYPTAEYDYRSVNGAFSSDTTNALTSSAASNNYLFVNDTRGSLYALDGSDITSNIANGVDTGYRRGISPNDPRGDAFRHLRVRLLNRTGYNTLRQTTNTTDNTGPLTYAQTITRTDPLVPAATHGGDLNKNYLTAATADGGVANPYAFEWGETAYVLVYNFPCVEHVLNSDGTEPTNDDTKHVDPPEVTVVFSVEGRVLRSPTVFAKKFLPGGTVPSVGGLDANGYAVASFAFNNSGTSALPPGTGRITTTIATAALSAIKTKLTIPQPRRGGATIYFVTANPLAITIAAANGQPGTETIGGGANLTNGAYLENIVNGTPNTTDKTRESQLHASTPIANHGTSVTTRVDVYDRSLIALLHEDGLSNFRVTRSNLMRQGGKLGVFYPLDSTLYPGFEDTPSTDFTNTSLDYPDIGREQVRVALGVNGATQNPVAVSSTLLPPTIDLGAGPVPVTIDNYDQGTRVPRPTPMDLTVDVPRYQPPVNLNNMLGTRGNVATLDGVRDLDDVRHDSRGDYIVNQGYFGRVQAFIDSDNNQRLTTDTSKETFRSFNMSTAVLPQFSVLTGTPTVDLGSLASGTGYSPADPHTAYQTNGFFSLFSPWFGDLDKDSDPRNVNRWGDAYRTISVRNDGNVNLRNLRLAKAYTNLADPATALPWTLPTLDNDPLAWMTAVLRGGSVTLPNDGNLAPGDLWSNIDTTFSAINKFTGGKNVILAKPRVTDRVPTELVANPYPRANPNIALSTATGTVVPKGTINSVLVNGTTDNRLDKRSVTVGAKTYAIPASSPRVGVSVPLGFPVGNYAAQVRVVENLLPFVNPIDNDILQTPPNVSEVYSDPITLTYKVRETRLTNRSTRRTAFMLDDPSGWSIIPNNWPKINADPSVLYSDRIAYHNSDPTAMRDLSGSMTVAWASDRASFDLTNQADVAFKVNPNRIFFGRVGTNGNAKPAGNPPLWDLSQFVGATTSQWFRSNNVAFPATGQINAMFPTGTPDAATVNFSSPSFPQRGPLNPLAQPGTEFNSSLGTVSMGFVGDAQLTTPTGRLSQSKVFLTSISTDGSGNVSGGTPVDLGGDPQTKKGKPSIAQIPNGTLAFFTETGAGQSGITVSRVNAGKITTSPLGFGDGFSSVFSPSASPRLYRGLDPNLSNSVPQAKGTGAIIDLSFAGKLRGRANAELFMGRLRLQPTDASLVDSTLQNVENRGAGSPFAALPTQTRERATSEGNGVYRTRGVDWTSTDGIAVQQFLPGQAVGTDLLIPATRAVDRQSGLIAYDSRLGGKAYVDPQLGTIRFTGATPNRNAEVRVTYTPYFLRVDPGGTAALNVSSVNGLWDDRFALDYDAAGAVTAPEYWFAGNAAVVSQIRTANAGSGVRNDRYFFAYGRGAAGGGITARPYTTSMRIGVRLPTRVYTDVNGNVVGIQVTGNKQPYQVDPANGRVYFMAEDEDNPGIVINYTGVNEATNLPVTLSVNGIKPSFVLERTETPLAVDEATNDTAIAAFLDPLTNQTEPRPSLYWLFYVSTRAGGPDLYFQSIAPRYTPFAK